MAYDRVEWNFIHSVMGKMGFDFKWIDLIMRCVSSISYSVIINGSRNYLFKPKRGLRPGDPLNLFLFLICSEVLSSLLHLSVQNGLLKGVKASRYNPLSHIFFLPMTIFCLEMHPYSLPRV